MKVNSRPYDVEWIQKVISTLPMPNSRIQNSLIQVFSYVPGAATDQMKARMFHGIIWMLKETFTLAITTIIAL